MYIYLFSRSRKETPRETTFEKIHDAEKHEQSGTDSGVVN